MQQKQEVDEDEEASEATSSSLERIDLTQSQMAAE
jgi:hypothetical protein